jgi:ribonucleoside-diphosphate reductase alpha chain
MRMSKPESTLPCLNANALYILKKRYLARDASGKIVETPAQLFRRVADFVAQAERKYDRRVDIEKISDEFYTAMAKLEFLPNSPTLLNAGRLSGQLSSCFVLPVEDSDIAGGVKEAVIVHQSGGGTGFNLSRVPPRGEKTKCCGPVAFLNPLSEGTSAVKQGGIRRGCNIATLDVHHPDILDFIRAKDRKNALSNFYLSVGITEQFMQAVERGEDYDLLDPLTGKTAGKLNARKVFNRIVSQTWKTGDPGLLFLDRLHAANPVPALGEIEGVSGCGEQMLLAYESCNLGSINLTKMLTSERKPQIDYDKLAATVRLSVRFLDDVIDVNKYPLPQIREATLRTRKIGLGVMGFADTLAAIGIPYASEKAVTLAEDIMEFIKNQAHTASSALAGERGIFPAFKGSVYDAPGGRPMRNASCTTIAPTGTISLIAGCSAGIEPLYALVYLRRVQGGRNLLDVDEQFVPIARKKSFFSPELLLRLANGERLADIEGVPKSIVKLFATAPEIPAKWHVRMQAAFQRHVDNAVSKTVNLPDQATRRDVAAIYKQAYREGLKGITIYRDGSRRAQPLAGRVKPKLLERYLKLKP